MNAPANRVCGTPPIGGNEMRPRVRRSGRRAPRRSLRTPRHDAAPCFTDRLPDRRAAGGRPSRWGRPAWMRQACGGRPDPWRRCDSSMINARAISCATRSGDDRAATWQQNHASLHKYNLLPSVCQSCMGGSLCCAGPTQRQRRHCRFVPPSEALMPDRSAHRTSFATGHAKAEGSQCWLRYRAARLGAIALCMTLAAYDGDRTMPPAPASQTALAPPVPAPFADGASTFSAIPPAGTMPPAPAANAFQPRVASPQAAAR
jgi:hypothetical protein